MQYTVIVCAGQSSRHDGATRAHKNLRNQHFAEEALLACKKCEVTRGRAAVGLRPLENLNVLSPESTTRSSTLCFHISHVLGPPVSSQNGGRPLCHRLQRARRNGQAHGQQQSRAPSQPSATWAARLTALPATASARTVTKTATYGGGYDGEIKWNFAVQQFSFVSQS